MSGRTVIITGATKGLGRALALEFASAGDRVIGLYSSDERAADTLRADLAAGAIIEKHDVTMENPAFWDRAEIQQAEKLVLINNAAASFAPTPFHLLKWDEVQRSIEVSVKGSWLASRAVIRPMVRAGGGTIVNVLTTALSDAPPKGFAGYLAAKHALRGITLSLASEYAEKGVRVFSVSPGFMDTPMTAKWDARLTESIRASAPASDPVTVSRKVRDLIDAFDTVGRGEDYLV